MSKCIFCEQPTAGGNHYQSTECIQALQEEIVRLRLALEAIAEMPDQQMRIYNTVAIRIAKAALEGESHA